MILSLRRFLLFLSTVVVTSTANAGNPQVEIRTSEGTIYLELYPDVAPQTVGNFLEYVGSGHYNSTIFHRVIDGFMIQGGGFDRSLRQLPTRSPIVNEAQAGVRAGLRNVRGTIAMARTRNPNSATAQFFINVSDNQLLDWGNPRGDGSGYAVFGKVVSGMDVVMRISRVPTGAGGSFQGNVPVNPIVIESVAMSQQMPASVASAAQSSAAPPRPAPATAREENDDGDQPSERDKTLGLLGQVFTDAIIAREEGRQDRRREQQLEQQRQQLAQQQQWQQQALVQQQRREQLAAAQRERDARAQAQQQHWPVPSIQWCLQNPRSGNPNCEKLIQQEQRREQELREQARRDQERREQELREQARREQELREAARAYDHYARTVDGEYRVYIFNKGNKSIRCHIEISYETTSWSGLNMSTQRWQTSGTVAVSPRREDYYGVRGSSGIGGHSVRGLGYRTSCKAIG